MRTMGVLAVVAMCALGAREAGAMLGERRSEVKARYGSERHEVAVFGLKGGVHWFNGFNLIVLYSEDGFSAMEYLQPVDVSRHLDEKECLALARAITGATNWTATQLLGTYSQKWKSDAGHFAEWKHGIASPDSLIVYGSTMIAYQEKQKLDSAAALEKAFSAPTKVEPQKEVAALAVTPEPPVLPPMVIKSKERLAEEAKVEANRLKFTLDQATNGVASAQYELGLRYLEGRGVEKDELAARSWLEKAAGKGHTYAKRALANLPGESK